MDKNTNPTANVALLLASHEFNSRAARIITSRFPRQMCGEYHILSVLDFEQLLADFETFCAGLDREYVLKMGFERRLISFLKTRIGETGHTLPIQPVIARVSDGDILFDPKYRLAYIVDYGTFAIRADRRIVDLRGSSRSLITAQEMNSRQAKGARVVECAL